MTFGLAVFNDLGRKVIDETHSLHVAAPGTAKKGHKMWSEPYGAGFYWYERVEATYTFTRPYKGVEPPMIFMRTNTGHPSLYDDAMEGDWTHHFWMMWYNNIRYQFFGVPGNWTGVFIASIHYNGFSYDGVNPPAARWTSFDRRGMFMISGTSVNPGTDGYGAIVYDAEGRVVFNSNDNFIEVLQYSNNWQYQSRNSYGSQYIEQWINPDIVMPSYSSGEWISMIPYSMYRRYNGETAEVFASNLTAGYNLGVGVIGGRSGSPFHMPILRVKTKLPFSYTFI